MRFMQIEENETILGKILRPSIRKRALFFIVNDFILSLFTFYIAYLLRFNFHIPENFLKNFIPFFMILVSFKLFLFYWFRIYNTPWRFFSLGSFEKIVKALEIFSSSRCPKMGKESNSKNKLNFLSMIVSN